jgi:hypothetical protein
MAELTDRVLNTLCHGIKNAANTTRVKINSEPNPIQSKCSQRDVTNCVGNLVFSKRLSKIVSQTIANTEIKKTTHDIIDSRVEHIPYCSAPKKRIMSGTAKKEDQTTIPLKTIEPLTWRTQLIVRFLNPFGSLRLSNPFEHMCNTFTRIHCWIPAQ